MKINPSLFKIQIKESEELNSVFKITLIAFIVSWFISNLFYHFAQSTTIDDYFSNQAMTIFYSWIAISGLLYLYEKTKNFLLGLCIVVFRVVAIPLMFILNDISFSDVIHDPFLFIDILFEGVLLLFFSIRLAQLSFLRVQLLNHQHASYMNYFYDFQSLEKKYFFILSGVFFILFIFGIININAYIGFFIFGFTALVALLILTLGIIYIAWKLIEDQHPLQKTLLLLIPLYNLHQIFVAVRDYPAQYNKYCQENDINTWYLDEQPFSWMAWGLLALVIFGSKFFYLGFAYFIVVQVVNSKLIDVIQTMGSIQNITVESQKNGESGLFLAIVSKVTKADGRVSELEAEMVSNLLDDITSSFSFPQKARSVFKTIFDKEKNLLDDVFDKANLLYKKTLDSERKRIQYFEFLLSLAFVDGDIQTSEEKMLFGIYNALRLDANLYNDLLEKFRVLSAENQREPNQHNTNSSNSDNEPYYILGADQSDTNNEIKSKYRALVKKYHPDIMSGQGLDEEFIELATKKLQQINSAYEKIKQQRGL